MDWISLLAATEDTTYFSPLLNIYLITKRAQSSTIINLQDWNGTADTHVKDYFLQIATKNGLSTRLLEKEQLLFYREGEEVRITKDSSRLGRIRWRLFLIENKTRIPIYTRIRSRSRRGIYLKEKLRSRADRVNQALINTKYVVRPLVRLTEDISSFQNPAKYTYCPPYLTKALYTFYYPESPVVLNFISDLHPGIIRFILKKVEDPRLRRILRLLSDVKLGPGVLEKLQRMDERLIMSTERDYETIYRFWLDRIDSDFPPLSEKT